MRPQTYEASSSFGECKQPARNLSFHFCISDARTEGQVNSRSPCRAEYLARSTLQLFRRSAVLLGTERPLDCYVLLEISEFGFIGRKPHENSHTAAWSLGHCCRTVRNGGGRAVYSGN